MDYLGKLWRYKYWLLLAVVASGIVTTLAISKRYIPQRYEAKVEFRLNGNLTIGILTDDGQVLLFDATAMQCELRERGDQLAEAAGKSEVMVTLDGSNKYTILTRSADPEVAYTITMELFGIAQDSILAYVARAPFGHQMERHEKYVEILENGITVLMDCLKADTSLKDKTQLLETAYKLCMDSVTVGLQGLEPIGGAITVLYKTPKGEVSKSLSPVWYILLSMGATLVIGLIVVLMYGNRNNSE